MIVGSLFTGACGLDKGIMASDIADGHDEYAWVSDLDERDGSGHLVGRAATFLRLALPDVLNLGDITCVDWSTVQRPDVILGGSPCQDLSTAGTRAGMLSGTRSGLWYSMCAAISVTQPTWVVWENVRGALTAHTGVEGVTAVMRVTEDLESLGYAVRWGTFAAVGVGAAHKRERVFVLAHRSNKPSNKRISITSMDGVSTEHTTLPTPTVRDSKDYRIRVEPHRPWDTGSTLSRALTHYEDFSASIAQWEHVMQMSAPRYYEDINDGIRLSPAFSEWLMGHDKGWITDRGLPRYAQFALIGNGVVPQQATHAINTLADTF